MLGANIVIGGKRARLFTDGRPTAQTARKQKESTRKFSKAVIEIVPNEQLDVIPSKPIKTLIITGLPERQRPDGEEVEKLTGEVDQSPEEELEWEAWEENHVEQIEKTKDSVTLVNTENSEDEIATVIDDLKTKSFSSKFKKEDFTQKKNIQDIDELDIKNQKAKEPNDDIDFFQDMEPEIKSSTKYLIGQEEVEDISDNLNKLNVMVAEFEEDGWGEEDWE